LSAACTGRVDQSGLADSASLLVRGRAAKSRQSSRGRSSAGRAPALQAGGHRFDPGRLQTMLCPDMVYPDHAQPRPCFAQTWSTQIMLSPDQLYAAHCFCIAECSAFGLSACAGTVSGVARSSVSAIHPGLQRQMVVMWSLQCESGSGASLGAQSVVRFWRSVVRGF
jgi:hypothetical protein